LTGLLTGLALGFDKVLEVVKVDIKVIAPLLVLDWETDILFG
jgi:hypothetical protein